MNGGRQKGSVKVNVEINLVGSKSRKEASVTGTGSEKGLHRRRLDQRAALAETILKLAAPVQTPDVS